MTRAQRTLDRAISRYERAERLTAQALQRSTKAALRLQRATMQQVAAGKAWETRDRELYAAAEALRLARRAL